MLWMRWVFPPLRSWKKRMPALKASGWSRAPSDVISVGA